MLKYKRNLVLDIYDYAGNKQCSLYDQTSDASGQAYEVFVTTERNGWKQITFNLPQNIHTDNGDEENYRLQYIKEGYRIRLVDDDGVDWFILSESKISHNNYTKTLSITAGHVSQLLKHKRLDLEFNDEEGNNVGTPAMLLETILEGTGWTVGTIREELFQEKDKTPKYRSMKANAKTGAFKLISNMCDLFEAKPIYHGDTKTVDIIPLNPFEIDADTGLPEVNDYKYYRNSNELNDHVIELHYGTNVKNVSRTLDEENLITKLYAYGSYGEKDTGYCGIDECKHHVYKLINGEPVDPGTECSINLRDAYDVNVFKFFKFGDESSNLQNISTVYWSDLDPASRMYVWDPVNERAYFLYENKQEPGDALSFTEDEESEREEKQNWFSFLLDFDYYKDIDLFTDTMLQEVARYQQDAPGLMQIVSEKATDFSEALTDLSETIGTVDFCKLDCTIQKPNNGHVQLVLNHSEQHPNGVIYRTDYLKKEDKYFKWRVATELKANGDPVHNVASVVYIVYDSPNEKNIKYDKAYLKEIDNEDEPRRLTLWLPSDKSNYTNQQYRVYLFAQYNVNGLLGAYESASEARQKALETTTKIVTIKHPVFYEKQQPNVPISTTYSWWWKVYDDFDTPSELYFCWSSMGDAAWKRVIITNEDPEQQQGDYWFNWKKAVLYRKEDDYWIAKNKTANDKLMSSLFGAVYSNCQTRDRYEKGVYQKYIYTQTGNTTLPSGNYAFSNGYGGYWVFTTEEELEAGDTLTYDSTQDTVLQKVSDEETVLEVKSYRFDNVTYHSENLLSQLTYETGGLSETTGGEISSEPNRETYRTGFLRAYPNTVYYFNGYNGNLNVFYYDENRNYLGYDVVYGYGGFITTPSGLKELTEVGEINVGGTKYIRIVSDTLLDANTMNVSTPDSANKIITKEDETYLVIQWSDTEFPLKGITPLTKKFADLADQAYGVCYPAMKSAQEDVKDLENSMTVALGDLYREGYWQKNDYVDGDEQKLYDDALDNIEKLAKPEAKYEIGYLDRYGSDYDNEDNTSAQSNQIIDWPDISTQSAVHLVDPEVNINAWAFVDKVQKCYDQPWKTKITINTNLTGIGQHSFTDVMTHIAEVAGETKSKMSVYERASYITDNGILAADRLQGKIDANKLQITGGSSTWYTDDNGNMVFVSADGNSAMTLTGNGFAIANSKDVWGDWNWRVFGTGEGFTADEIVAGYLSAERILAGSITTSHLDAGVAGELDLSANKSIKLIVQDLSADLEGKMAALEITPEKIWLGLQRVETFTNTYATKQEVSSAVNNIQIGTRNYILNSKTMILENVHGVISMADEFALVDYAVVDVSIVCGEED